MAINPACRKRARQGHTARWDKCSKGGEKGRERGLAGLPGGSRIFYELEERALVSLYKGKLGDRRTFEKKAVTRNGGPVGPRGAWVMETPMAPVPNLQKGAPGPHSGLCSLFIAQCLMHNQCSMNIC